MRYTSIIKKNKHTNGKEENEMKKYKIWFRINEYLMINDYEEIKGEPREEDDYIFINFRGQALTRQGIWKILKEYGKEMDIEERMTPQILRNSFAVHILQNGGDLKTLQELMGFEDMSVGIAYLAVLNVRIRDVYQRTHPRA